MRRAAPAPVVLLAALAAPATASAHGLPGPPPLPIPQWLFYWAAAMVLLASFVALAVAWPRPRLLALAEGHAVALAVFPRRLAGSVVSALGLVFFALVVWAGLTGTAEPLSNLAPTAVYVTLWVGVPVASLVVGDVWALVSPWRTITRVAGTVARLVGGPGGTPEPLAYPARLGRWPAAALLLAFGWLELVAGGRDDPSLLAVLALAYAALMLVGASLFGAAFLERADGFGVYFNLAARLSPLRWTRDGVRMRTPGSGVASIAPAPGTFAVVAVLLGTTTFDGFSGTALWGDDGGLAARFSAAAGGLGLGPGPAATVAATAGLVLGVLFVAAVIALATGGMRWGADDAPGFRTLAVRFAPTLVPVAIGYAVAHYFSLLVTQGQGIAPLLSDPRGNGANWLGTAGWNVDYTIFSGQFYWYVQVLALLAGHVLALVAAHDVGLRTLPGPRAAARSQYPMLVAMVVLTCLGLWLVAQ